MTKTSIEWTDETWNPVTGCDKVSPGCDHCYAEGIANRFGGTPQFPNGFGMTLRPERLQQPLRWKRPRRVFVNSMSDLFHEGVSESYIAGVFAVMALANQHTFQILTKRHGRMRSLLNSPAFREEVTDRYDGPSKGDWVLEWPLPNVWLGVSAEDQKWADIRIPALLGTPAAVRFISAEPLLGPIDLNSPRLLAPDVLAGRLDWVIVGGESGRGARPMHPDWAQSLRDQCTSAGVPFLFKQWGEWIPNGSYMPRTGTPTSSAREYVFPADGPDHMFYPLMARVGKKAAGRELDGRTWDQYPGGAE